jgi:hypothetical protein
MRRNRMGVSWRSYTITSHSPGNPEPQLGMLGPCQVGILRRRPRSRAGARRSQGPSWGSAFPGGRAGARRSRGAELGLGVPRGRAGARRSRGAELGLGVPGEPSWGSAFPGAELGLGAPRGRAGARRSRGAELGLGVPGEPSWGSALPGCQTSRALRDMWPSLGGSTIRPCTKERSYPSVASARCAGTEWHAAIILADGAVCS